MESEMVFLYVYIIFGNNCKSRFYNLYIIRLKFSKSFVIYI